MFRNIFRTKSLTSVTVQVFLNRNQCILNRMRNTPILTKCSSGKFKYSGTRSYLTYQKILHGKSRNYYFVFGGILTFFGLKPEGEEESELIMMIKRGILCIKRGQFQKAEKTLHDALKMAYEEQNEDGITYIYDILANLFLDTGQIQKAEKLFINVMQRLLGKGYEATDDKMIHISLKLAKIYEMTEDNLKAETGYKYCINSLENKLNTLNKEENESSVDTLKLWITTLDTYARFLVSQTRAEEAIGYFQKALDMCVQVNGKQHEDTALLLNDLGMASNILGDLDSAVLYTEEAAEIGKNIVEMEHLPIIYINLAYLYLSKEMYNESKLACEKGLKFARRDEDEDNIQKGKECLLKIKEALEKNKN